MLDDVISNMCGDFDIKPLEVMNLQPLVLAYIGDAIYEAYVRTMLVVRKKTSVNMLHKMSVKYVKAKAQSDILKRIMDKLTPEEQAIVKRGRNAKSATVPKHAEVTDYRYSTGYEALIGYLYLIKQGDRLMEILRLSVEEEAVSKNQPVEEDSVNKKQTIEEDAVNKKQTVEEDTGNKKQSVEEDAGNKKQTVEEDTGNKKQSMEEESINKKPSIEEESE